MEKLKKFEWGKVWGPSIMITLIGLALGLGQYIQSMDSRTLSTVEMRIDLERHMKIWTTTTPKEAFARLEAVEDSAIQFKSADSLAKIERDIINTKLNLILKLLKDK